jgi:hypothetical protein
MVARPHARRSLCAYSLLHRGRVGGPAATTDSRFRGHDPQMRTGSVRNQHVAAIAGGTPTDNKPWMSFSITKDLSQGWNFTTVACRQPPRRAQGQRNVRFVLFTARDTTGNATCAASEVATLAPISNWSSPATGTRCRTSAERRLESRVPRCGSESSIPKRRAACLIRLRAILRFDAAGNTRPKGQRICRIEIARLPSTVSTGTVYRPRPRFPLVVRPSAPEEIGARLASMRVATADHARCCSVLGNAPSQPIRRRFRAAPTRTPSHR